MVQGTFLSGRPASSSPIAGQLLLVGKLGERRRTDLVATGPEDVPRASRCPLLLIVLSFHVNRRELEQVALKSLELVNMSSQAAAWHCPAIVNDRSIDALPCWQLNRADDTRNIWR